MGWHMHGDGVSGQGSLAMSDLGLMGRLRTLRLVSPLAGRLGEQLIEEYSFGSPCKGHLRWAGSTLFGVLSIVTTCSSLGASSRFCFLFIFLYAFLTFK